MLTNALIVLGLVVVAVLIYVAMRPDTFRVERHIVIDRPPAAIFALIDDFHQWRLWSPWEELDPALQRSYRGAGKGVGAIYEWEGNKKAGKGHMEITREQPPTHVTVDLTFLRPFRAENNAAFDLEPDGGRTRVSWAIYGPLPFMSKLFGLFVSMEGLIGKDFERGLEKLKAVAEHGDSVPTA